MATLFEAPLDPATPPETGGSTTLSQPLPDPTDIPTRRLVEHESDGHRFVVTRVGSRLHAMREICPCCGSSLVWAPVRRALVTCAVCTQGFDLQRRGGRVDGSGPGLEPLPVVEHEGRRHIAWSASP